MNISTLATATFATVTLTLTAYAAPVSVTHENLPECDFLLVPEDLDELGINFPPDELIDAVDKLTDQFACPSSDPGVGLGNRLVSIFNLAGQAFDNLWYVADPETRFTNVDGLVNGHEAFKIDRVGLNRPLVFESINANGIFEPGEQWDFIVDGYSNLNGLAASALFSVAAVGFDSGGEPLSSASVIATPVVIPEPTAALLVLFAVAAPMCHCRRR
ncbi:MAG: hypothetical protein AAGF31_03015 [Planctomycetota bacterium]